MDALRGRCRVIAIKQNVDLAPWAAAVYGCDGHWWRYRRGLPEYRGLKMAWSGAGLAEYPDIVGIEIAKGERDRFADHLVLGPVGTVGGGGNSGFQALNLAVQFGARRVLLIGFDMSDAGGVHWYGRNNWPMSGNPSHWNFPRWVAAFKAAAEPLRDAGVAVYNASPQSALTCFPKTTVAEFLEGPCSTA